MIRYVCDLYSDRNTVGRRWRSLYFATIGGFAGFSAALTVLAADVLSARGLGFYAFRNDAGRTECSERKTSFVPAACAVYDRERSAK